MMMDHHSLSRSLRQTVTRAGRRILGFLCVALAVGMALFFIPFAWILRDGVAPDMVMSEGSSAIAHFVILYIITLIPVGALVLAAWALLRTPHKKEDHVA
jgi:TRAP-type C4-dicarboxylate transport system permease small subunit